MKNIKISTRKMVISWTDNFIVTTWFTKRLLGIRSGQTRIVSYHTLNTLTNCLSAAIISLVKKQNSEVNTEIAGLLFPDDWDKNFQYNRKCLINALCDIKPMLYLVNADDEIKVTIYND